tara:strand:+ start:188 stop:967 length:780 start_codon:yes stop_codon:yes gene_type:complete
MWDYKTIKRDIDRQGYYVFKNYLKTKDLKKIKSTLLETLNYIDGKKDKNLIKKYFTIRDTKPKLKGNWYDISPYNIDLLQSLHKKKMIDFVKKYFKTNVVFSGRPAIHVHDDLNDKLLEAHQETNQFARDTLVFWCPLYDTNKKTGGLSVYERSHQDGYFTHNLENSKLGAKSWTKFYTHIKEKNIKSFKKKNLEVKAGTAIIFISSLVHSGYPSTKKGSLRITITERFNPLQKIPFLKNEKAPLKMPYVGIDYNKVKI